MTWVSVFVLYLQIDLCHCINVDSLYRLTPEPEILKSIVEQNSVSILGSKHLCRFWFKRFERMENITILNKKCFIKKLLISTKMPNPIRETPVLKLVFITIPCLKFCALPIYKCSLCTGWPLSMFKYILYVQVDPWARNLKEYRWTELPSYFFGVLLFL